jgi:hypothetical protein
VLQAVRSEGLQDAELVVSRPGALERRALPLCALSLHLLIWSGLRLRRLVVCLLLFVGSLEFLASRRRQVLGGGRRDHVVGLLVLFLFFFVLLLAIFILI